MNTLLTSFGIVFAIMSGVHWHKRSVFVAVVYTIGACSAIWWGVHL